MRASKVRTPERDAIILRDYPLGVDTDVILAAVNALPGEQTQATYIWQIAKKLKVRRPDWFVLEVRQRGLAASAANKGTRSVAARIPVPVVVLPRVTPVAVHPVPQLQRALDPRPYAGLLAHRAGGGFSMLRPR